MLITRLFCQRMLYSQEIARHVADFRAWIAEVFTEEQIASGAIDDAGYPRWRAVEATFEKVFEAENLDAYSAKVLDDLVYLVARQWDVGRILNWFDKGDRRISHCGMNGYHLLALAQAGVRSPERDARYQFAASLYKLGPDPRVVALMLKYLQDEDSYCRRLALRSLSRIRYEGVLEEVRKMWDNGDEWDRMMCLSIAKDHDAALLQELLEQGRASDQADLLEYIKRNNFSG